jgi:hypothetical protein
MGEGIRDRLLFCKWLFILGGMFLGLASYVVVAWFVTERALSSGGLLVGIVIAVLFWLVAVRLIERFQ